MNRWMTATRNVIYEVEEAKPISLSVLAGYGSYELLRGGLEVEDRNLFGLAHDLQLRAVQSFKSSSGDLLYTRTGSVRGECESISARLGFAARGGDLSRARNTAGRSASKSCLVPLKTDFTLRYVYEFLNSRYLQPEQPQS